MGPEEMKQIAELIDRVLRSEEDKEDPVKLQAFRDKMAGIKGEVKTLTDRFPLY